MSNYILSIDPGNTESAYCLIDEMYQPIETGKVDNDEMLSVVDRYQHSELVVEMVASYGMPVGATVFETCVWIGRFIEHADTIHHLVYRKDVKMNLCNSMRAKDSNIRQALIDRFGIVGTKKSPGWFYGFKRDIWSAYAVGITYLDSLKGGEVTPRKETTSANWSSTQNY